MACWNSMAAPKGINSTPELDQRTIARQLYKPATVPGQRGF
jgi:hypothetical protein